MTGNLIMKREDVVAALNRGHGYLIFASDFSAPCVCRLEGQRLHEVLGTVRRDTLQKMIADGTVELVDSGTNGMTYRLCKC